jgi:hypothetical protein
MIAWPMLRQGSKSPILHREAALREAAAQRADDLARRARAGEDDAVREITGDTDEEAADTRPHATDNGW